MKIQKNKILIFLISAVFIFITAFFLFGGNSGKTVSFNTDNTKNEIAKTNLSPNEFSEMAKQNDAVILDVRSAFEFNGYKIQNAQNISFTSSGFKSYIENLDKNKIYLVYCATGSRSINAVNFMKSSGFKNVYNLSGGIEHWKSEKLPVVR